MGMGEGGDEGKKKVKSKKSQGKRKKRRFGSFRVHNEERVSAETMSTEKMGKRWGDWATGRVHNWRWWKGSRV
jgi:hypothetical protein